jgi:transposase
MSAVSCCKLIILSLNYNSFFISQEELEKGIEDYIYYYNNKRIKEKLKGLTPASYRSQSLLVS